MRDASVSSDPALIADATVWRELHRCDDLRTARIVATSIAAMEYDVRLTSVNPRAWLTESDDESESCCGAGRTRCECDIPGPHVIEVPADVLPQLAGVISDIIDEQREFDELLELRRERHRGTLVLVLSATTAAEVLLIWRLIES